MARDHGETPLADDGELDEPTIDEIRPTSGKGRGKNGSRRPNSRPAGYTPADDKPDKLELATRIEILTNLVVRGYTRSETWRYVTTQTEWRISDRTFQRYMKRVDAELRKDGERIREIEVAKALRRNDLVFQRAFKDKDYRGALRANLQTTRLLGLEAPKVVRTGQDPDSDPATPPANVNASVVLNFVETPE